MQISGTDALKIHLGAEPNDLLADLAELNRIATAESPAPEFDAIARVRPLRAADERRPELDRRLETLLGDSSAGSIAVTVPTTLLGEEDGAMPFWVKMGTLLQTSTGLSLIDWTADLKDEKEYHREATKHGYVCLDRALIKADLHPHGFEACDLFSPSNELVHVKRAKSTAPLNHLFAQGRISADALRWDSAARSKLLSKVRARNPQHPVEDDFMPRKVIYGISLKSGKPLTVKNLLTFAQVSLLQAAVALRNSGIEVAVVNIPTVP